MNDIFAIILLVLIVTCLYLDCLVLERLLNELRSCLVVVLVLPATYIEEVLVVALCLALWSLVLLAEVTTA